MFSLLGEEGYKLHRELINASIEYEKMKPPLIEDLTDCSASSTVSSNRQSKMRNNLLLCECAERNRTGSFDDAHDSYISEIMSRFKRKEISVSEITTISNLLVFTAEDELKKFPRDIALYSCLGAVMMMRYMINGEDSALYPYLDTLDKSLELANQASAVGMVGWLENESSSSLDRMLERSLEILADKAAFYGSVGNWRSARNILWSLLLRCEQHLPLYHPITLSVMLDLAAAMLETKEDKTAERIVQRANQRLAIYLVEQEERVIKGMDVNEKNGNRVKFHNSIVTNTLSMLEAFVVKMKRLEKRTMMYNLEMNHPIRLIYSCFLADSLTVLANCVGLDQIRFDNRLDSAKSQECCTANESLHTMGKRENLWSIAGEYYRKALAGWMHVYGIRHPNVPSCSCGLARCLRELGRRDEAIIILSSAVGAWRGKSPLTDQHLGDSKIKNGTTKISQWNIFTNPSDCNTDKTHYDQIVSKLNLATEEGLAMCLWWMAVYFVESNPNERGRIRALSLLQASSESLQLVVKKKSSQKGESNGLMKFSGLLEIIESEAKKLFSFEVDSDEKQDKKSIPWGERKELAFMLSSV